MIRIYDLDNFQIVLKLLINKHYSKEVIKNMISHCMNVSYINNTAIDYEIQRFLLLTNEQIDNEMLKYI